MTQENKELLLRDLSARLPYEVEVYYSETVPISTLKTINSEKGTCIVYDHSQWYRHSKFHIEEIKPYLRPTSSMTEEEKKEYKHLVAFSGSPNGAANFVDWLNKKMFAYRTLDGKDMFELGIALEAPKGMYK